MLPKASTRSFINNLREARLTPEAAAADAAPSTAAPVRTVACMVTHGMGQQVPFETCAGLAEAFVRGDRKLLKPPEANRVHLVEGGPILSRMELTYAATETEPETQLHIYEGYWAPLTAGKISAVKTLLFLFSAGGRGIWSCFHRAETSTGEKAAFARWVFGDLRQFSIKRHTLTALFWTVIFLALAVFAAVEAEHELHRLWANIVSIWHSTGSFLTALHLLWQHYTWSLRYSLWHTFLFALESLWLYYSRYFLVEFVGDVVIYVSSYQVSEFQQIRDEIQRRVLTVGQQIVSAKTQDGAALYDRLVFVGHSLGSVITYDLVNALLVWDATECGHAHNVQQRLSSLITFGSPLDKTAFLFRTQVSPEHHYREAMAANMQPLILSYGFRTFPWINIHSRLDPVSGALAYYDWPADPTAPGHLIQNKPDPQARIPAYAHVQYWNNKLLTEELHAAIQR